MAGKGRRRAPRAVQPERMGPTAPLPSGSASSATAGTRASSSAAPSGCSATGCVPQEVCGSECASTGECCEHCSTGVPECGTSCHPAPGWSCQRPREIGVSAEPANCQPDRSRHRAPSSTRNRLPGTDLNWGWTFVRRLLTLPAWPTTPRGPALGTAPGFVSGGRTWGLRGWPGSGRSSVGTGERRVGR